MRYLNLITQLKSMIKKNVNSFVNIMTDVDKALPGSWNNQTSKMIWRCIQSNSNGRFLVYFEEKCGIEGGCVSICLLRQVKRL